MGKPKAAFRFFHKLEIRYADIDAQRHVNSARYFTFMEQARAAYLRALGLWQGQDFDSIGIILAKQSCTYAEAIRFGAEIAVGVATEKIGDKSLHMVYSIRDAGDQRQMAHGETLLVAYDYRNGHSIPVPAAWRARIEAFEAGA